MSTTGEFQPVGSKPERVYCNLLTVHALSVMVENMPDLNSHLDQIKAVAKRHGHYPDGTLFIEGGDSADRLWDMIVRNGLLGCGVCQPNGYGSLEPFPKKVCRIYYTKDYSEELGDLGFVIAFPSMWKCETKDYRLEDLMISVGFYRIPSDDVKSRFMVCLSDWFQSVSQQGLFGEGPINQVSKELEFRGRLAQFRIDVSRSGQDTLNWLLLTVLNFGYAVSAVTDFIFDHEKQIERFVGPISSKVEKLKFHPLDAVKPTSKRVSTTP
jgi:hypothetical protein